MEKIDIYKLKKKFLPSRRKFVIYLDTFLLLVFILLLSPRMTGLALHELMGVIFFIPIIIHLLIAWPWIRNSIKHFFNKARPRTSINLCLNAILFILVVIEIVSGFAISQIALPFVGIKTIDDKTWQSLHNQTLNLTMLFVGLHIALNWEWIISILKKRLQAPVKNYIKLAPNFLKALLRVCIITVAAAIITLVLYYLLGQPSVSRLDPEDKIARFRPTLGHGILQFAGETFLIAIVIYIARRWLKVKL